MPDNKDSFINEIMPVPEKIRLEKKILEARKRLGQAPWWDEAWDDPELIRLATTELYPGEPTKKPSWWQKALRGFGEAAEEISTPMGMALTMPWWAGKWEPPPAPPGYDFGVSAKVTPEKPMVPREFLQELYKEYEQELGKSMRRAYEKAEYPGVDITPPFRFPWTPEEVREKPWRLDVRGLAEETTYLPLYLVGVGAGKEVGGNLVRQGLSKVRSAFSKSRAGKLMTDAESRALLAFQEATNYGKSKLNEETFLKALYGSPKVTALPTRPYPTYGQAAKAVAAASKNLWVKAATEPDNSDRTLLVQFSSKLLGKGEEPAARKYFDKLYRSRAGYARADDFWEIPTWIGSAAKNFPKSDVYIVRNVDEAAKFLNNAGYKNVMFSAMDVNVDFIKQLAKKYKGKIIVGGYVKKEAFKDMPNVRFYSSIQNAAKALGEKPKQGVSFHHFRGSTTIPRLCMSKGCAHDCVMCDVTRGVTTISKRTIDQQVEAIKELKPRLVYLDDKTFGQAPNYKYLPEVYARLKADNPEFDGFIVQTTAPQFLKIDPKFLKQSGIRYVELGVESYNDDILKRLRKPSTTKTIDQALDKARKNNIPVVPNVIIGLPWETKESYQRTLNFLRANSDIISHTNVYNLALYEDTDIAKLLGRKIAEDVNENVIRKSFHKNPKLHQWFADEVYKLSGKMLDLPVGVGLEGRGSPTVQKAVNLIRQAKPTKEMQHMLLEQRRATHQKKVAKYRALISKATTTEQRIRAKAALAGEEPAYDLIPLSKLGFTKEEVDELTRAISDSTKLLEYQKVNAIDALVGKEGKGGLIYAGKIPTWYELGLLERVFGLEFTKPFAEMRPWSARAISTTIDILNAPRTLLASMDLSATLRQGAVLAPSHPKEFVDAFKMQLKALTSEKNAIKLNEMHLGRTGEAGIDAEALKRIEYGLFIHDLSPGVFSTLAEREEAFMSKWLSKLLPIRASERSYATMLNTLRVNVYDAIVDGWRQSGKHFTENDLRELTRFINYATGRGALSTGEYAAQRTPTSGVLKAGLNVLFFSPRFQTSRILLPWCLASSSEAVRKIAARDLAAYASTTAMIMYLAYLGGAEVEPNPLSTDFGKIKVGKTRYDMLAGFGSYIRALWQTSPALVHPGEGLKKRQTGRTYEINALWNLVQAGRMKLSPIPAILADQLSGASVIGEEITYEKEDVIDQLVNGLMSMYPQTIIEAQEEYGLTGALIRTLPEAFGINTTTYDSTLMVANDVRSIISKLESDQEKFRKYIEEKEYGKAQEFARKNPKLSMGYDPRYGNYYSEPLRRLRAADREITSLEKMIDAVDADKTKLPEQKEQIIADLQRRIINIAQTAILSYDGAPEDILMQGGQEQPQQRFDVNKFDEYLPSFKK